MFIVGDIAGQYNALMRLVEGVDPADVLLLGDLVDRGPQSKEVVQWAIDNNVRTLMGNHEHMMIDYYRDTKIYDRNVWMMNGGWATNQQYENDPETLKIHLEWIEKLPKFYEEPGLWVSHAPKNPTLNMDTVTDVSSIRRIDDTLLWNRGNPREMEGVFQVFGHNSHWGLRKFGEWGICLDASRHEVLTGLHWPSKELKQVRYEEREADRKFNNEQRGGYCG